MDGGPNRWGWVRPVPVVGVFETVAARLVGNDVGVGGQPPGGQQAVQGLGGGAVQGLEEVHGARNGSGARRIGTARVAELPTSAPLPVAPSYGYSG